MSAAYFLGIDVGTQGVRVVLVSETGEVVAGREKKTALIPSYRIEQDPDEWWLAVQECLSGILENVPLSARNRIRAISVTSTSGTVLPLDKNNRPLHRAIMYSDTRQAEEGKRCRDEALRLHPSGYTAFNTSSGLPKMLWFMENYPDQAADIETWIHATDYIVGQLSGNFGFTDHTNALKSGYDLTNLNWPDYITDSFSIRKNQLQKVIPPGSVIGPLLKSLQVRWGLSDIVVAAGMTDGCASQVAGGAVKPGDWNTTIGTTLVIKGVTVREIKDPKGRLYCHRHPQGYWMPGGASNTGADWISQDFADENLQQLNEAAARLIPTGFLVYPLKQQGERFPFISSNARGFTDQRITDRAQLFAAGMEGVAYIERLSYEMIESLSGEKVGAIYSSGGGSNSDTWMKIRANTLSLPVYRMSQTSGALGAAILAASQTYFSNLTEAASAMTRAEACFEPEADLAGKYDDEYYKFVNELKKRGYLNL